MTFDPVVHDGVRCGLPVSTTPAGCVFRDAGDASAALLVWRHWGRSVRPSLEGRVRLGGQAVLGYTPSRPSYELC
jgi:hypothetical protein